MILCIRNLEVAYGAVKALRGVSVNLARGEIVSVIGANGAGKSTMLRTVSGLMSPSAGNVLLEGQDITGLGSHGRVALGLLQVPEGRAILQNMSVAENLLVALEHGSNRRAGRTSILQTLKLFPQLSRHLEQRAGTLSGGQQQMLAIARALVSGPKVLLLDEPSLGLAPLVVLEVFRLIATLKERGTSILLVEQNVKQALAIADRAYVLELGRIKAEGRASEIASQVDILGSYLGTKVAPGGQQKEGER